MQAPRNWRNKEQRYRLTGVEFSDGSFAVQNKPFGTEGYQPNKDIEKQPDEVIEARKLAQVEAQ